MKLPLEANPAHCVQAEVGKWEHPVVERRPMVPPGVAAVTDRKRLRA